MTDEQRLTELKAELKAEAQRVSAMPHGSDARVAANAARLAQIKEFKALALIVGKARVAAQPPIIYKVDGDQTTLVLPTAALDQWLLSFEAGLGEDEQFEIAGSSDNLNWAQALAAFRRITHGPTTEDAKTW
jgi:hypothetical protein